MNKQLSMPLSQTAVSAEAPDRLAQWLSAALIVASGSAFAAMCAHVAVPLFFTPVPLTVQPFAVLILGLVLTPRMAAATFAAYLLEGAAGLPVFAPGPAPFGLAHLFGPTGGYLLAYPLAAALISFLWRRTGRSFAAAILAAMAGDVAILVCGASWLGLLTHISLLRAAELAALPFLPGDALKVAAAAGIAAGAMRLRRRSAHAEPAQ
jgi:biotin transport system substrate-specific component